MNLRGSVFVEIAPATKVWFIPAIILMYSSTLIKTRNRQSDITIEQNHHALRVIL